MYKLNVGPFPATVFLDLKKKHDILENMGPLSSICYRLKHGKKEKLTSEKGGDCSGNETYMLFPVVHLSNK